jgi:hypothetical protein
MPPIHTAEMARRIAQLALDLQTSPRWGGRRSGAGRKRGPATRLGHARRAPLSGRHPCHVTIKVRSGIPSLRNARLVHELESSWREIRNRNRFRIAHYSIQSNHVHLVVEAATASDLGSGMKSPPRGSRAPSIASSLAAEPCFEIDITFTCCDRRVRSAMRWRTCC